MKLGNGCQSQTPEYISKTGLTLTEKESILQTTVKNIKVPGKIDLKIAVCLRTKTIDINDAYAILAITRMCVL